jgi:DNA-binding Lrp family transcriptional regulator
LRLLQTRGSVRLQCEKESAMSDCVFVQLRCKPGTTYKVAEALVMKELHSELYSTSGEWDLLLKVYVPKGEDVGKFVNERLLDVAGIERSLTTLTFKVF